MIKDIKLINNFTLIQLNRWRCLLQTRETTDAGRRGQEAHLISNILGEHTLDTQVEISRRQLKRRVWVQTEICNTHFRAYWLWLKSQDWVTSPGRGRKNQKRNWTETVRNFNIHSLANKTSKGKENPGEKELFWELLLPFFFPMETVYALLLL